VTASETAPRYVHASTVLRRIGRSRLAAPVLLLVICCGFCWKLTLTNQYTWIDNHDITDMDVPRLQFQQVAWHNHEFPLWDPHLWCGQPFLGQIVGAACPLNWPLFLLKPNGKNQISIRQLNWYFVVLHFLGALFAYWLCRELGISRIASVFGGFLFSFSGFFAMTLWPEVIGGLLFAPLVLLFLVWALRRDRPFASAALCGMFLGLAWLRGHHEIPIYLSLAVAAILLYNLLSCRADWPRSLALAFTTVLFTVLTSGFQTIPGYEYAKLAVRWVGPDEPFEWNETIPYWVHAHYSLTPSSVIGILLPWATQIADIFAGIVVLSLALIAVFARWQVRSVRLFAALGMAGLLLALGGWNLFHGLLYSVVPLFQKTRNPNRLVFLFSLALAILAAFGLDYLRAGLQTPLIRIVRNALLVLAAFILALQIAAALQKIGPDDSLAMLGLIALLFAAVLFAGQKAALSNRFVTVAVMALAFMELGNVSTALFRSHAPDQHETFLPNLSQYRDIADFLRHQPVPARVNAEGTGTFNFGDWESIDTLTGFGAGVTKNLFSLDWPSVRTQNLLAVTYTLSKQPPRSDQEKVFHGTSGVNVLRNVDALPRVRLVHHIETVFSLKELRTRLDDASFDARNTVVMLDPGPALQSCAGEEQAHISKRTANSVVIDATLSCRAMLILADTWYPGWIATVDGRPAPIYQPYLVLRGVVLEGGAHHLEFHYQPASALIGAVMSVIGILGACALALWDRPPNLISAPAPGW
jgi:hypothetical protein